MNTAWIILFIAGLFEIAWAIGIKYSEGFTKLWPTVFTIVTMVVSFFLLGYAARTLPIGTAYAVWVGIGAAGVAILGIYLFEEPVDLLRTASISLIVFGVIGLKLGSA